MNSLKLDDHFAFKWSLNSSPEKVSATHTFNPNNTIPYPNMHGKAFHYRTSAGMIHTVLSFSLSNSGILTIISGPRSDWKPLHEKLLQKFKYRAYCKEERICEIKDIKFQDLECFFNILEEEPKLAYVDDETMVAFTEFQKPPLSERLKAINFDESKLPEKFFDNIITMDLMNDPVEARIDKPISIKDVLPSGKLRGAQVYDRKTFERLNGKCPVSNLPLKADPVPLSSRKFELIKIVEEAELTFESQNTDFKSMDTIIVSQGTTDPYLNNPDAYEILPDKLVTHEGKFYTKLSYEMKIGIAKRLIKIIQVIFLTIISCFIALAFETVRREWVDGVKGIKNITVLMPHDFL